jgi:hypothetical protein
MFDGNKNGKNFEGEDILSLNLYKPEPGHLVPRKTLYVPQRGSAPVRSGSEGLTSPQAPTAQRTTDSFTIIHDSCILSMRIFMM